MINSLALRPGHLELAQDGQVDIPNLIKAIELARKSSKPSFIRLKTVIAWPAPNARNTAASHGAPLGQDETKLTKKNLHSRTQY